MLIHCSLFVNRALGINIGRWKKLWIPNCSITAETISHDHRIKTNFLEVVATYSRHICILTDTCMSFQLYYFIQYPPYIITTDMHTVPICTLYLPTPAHNLSSCACMLTLGAPVGRGELACHERSLTRQSWFSRASNWLLLCFLCSMWLCFFFFSFLFVYVWIFNCPWAPSALLAFLSFGFYLFVDLVVRTAQ